MGKTKLRAAVVGLGMGKGHAKNYQNHPASQLVALCDLNQERLASTAKELGVGKTYTSYQEMFAKENLDVVSVATPNKFHKPVSLAAFKAGCHVHCEKPMAMSAAEGKEMVEAARKAKKRLMINFSFRFNPQSWALKQQVDAGLFGDFYFGRTVWHRRRGLPGFGGWFGQKQLSGGGPLIDLGVHRLDLALWLMGYPEPKVVLGSTYNRIAWDKAKKQGKKFDVEDLAAGFIKFKNGASLVVEASWAGNIPENELMETRLLGTKAGLIQRNVDEGYNFEMQISIEKQGVQYDMKLHKGSGSGPSSSVVHLLDCISANKPHIATGEEGLIVMKILDALYKSAATGKPVEMQ